MKTIYKKQLRITDTQIIEVPQGSIALSVGNQNEQLCVWYSCDNRAPLISIVIYIFGTGNPIPNHFDGTFVGTVIMANGALAWHVFKD